MVTASVCQRWESVALLGFVVAFHIIARHEFLYCHFAEDFVFHAAITCGGFHVEPDAATLSVRQARLVTISPEAERADDRYPSVAMHESDWRRDEESMKFKILSGSDWSSC